MFKVQKFHGMDHTITLSNKTAEDLTILSSGTISISYGMRKIKITLSLDSSMEDNIVGLSEDLFTELLIDEKSSYEILFRHETLIIGPVIGLLLGRSIQRLEKYIQHPSLYTQLHSFIKGVIFVFSEDQIDFVQEQITGYIFDPNIPTLWRKATLPFPGAIFRRVELFKETFQLLSKKMGRRFFNASYFNKWDFWKWVSPIPTLREHLPETTNEVTLESLQSYLDRFQSVFLKPRGGSRGQGIYYITKKEKYVVQKNYSAEPKELDEIEMKKFLFAHSYHLLQEPILLKTYENRKVDYRAYIQKDQNGVWQCTGLIARFGKADAFSSNFKANGFAKNGYEALKLQFNYNKKQAYQKFEEIVKVCIEMAKAIDQIGGSYADLGIDVGIDTDGKVYIIEINKRPDHDLPLLIHDQKMFLDIKANPILYCKYLAMDTDEKIY